MAKHLQTETSSSSGIGDNLKILEDVAVSVRRMNADESFDDEGVRTIWHRGRQRTEMLTWETKGGHIVRHELSFFGMVVEYDRDRSVRTGRIPHDEPLTDAGKQRSHLVEMNESVDPTVLDYASHLLKHVPGRDFYAQHLLKQINMSITSMGFDDARTAVSTLDSFSREKKRLPTMDTKTESVSLKQEGRKRKSLPLPLLGLVLALAGLALGALLGWLLL